MNDDLPKRLEKLRASLDHPELGLRYPILDDRQFTNDDVVAVTMLSPTQLHNWVSRGWVKLRDGHSPGKGRRRLFTGREVIAIELAQAFAPYSLVQVASQMIECTGWVTSRAVELLTIEGGTLGRWIRVIPIEDDWLYVPDTAPASDMPTANYAYLTVQIDRLIIGTLERLALLVDGQAVPPKDMPKPPTKEDIRKETEDFFGIWDTDSEGRKVRTGLTYEETVEFEPLDATDMTERLHDFDAGPLKGGMTREQRARHAELSEKHDAASHVASMTRFRDQPAK